MVFYICLCLAVLVGIILMALPSGNRKDRGERLWPTLGVVALISAAGFVVSFLIAIQGDPYAETELISSKQVEDVGYSESSNRRGHLIGNYTYNIPRKDADGGSFLVAESVRVDSTSLYVEEDLKDERIEQYQGYWYEPNVFPWRIWSFQPYRIYTTENPR